MSGLLRLVWDVARDLMRVPRPAPRVPRLPIPHDVDEAVSAVAAYARREERWWVVDGYRAEGHQDLSDAALYALTALATAEAVIDETRAHLRDEGEL